MRPTLAALLSSSFACATTPTDFPVIDVHTHAEFSTTPEPSSGITPTRERYLAELREIGASGAVAHTSSSGGSYEDLRAHGVIHCAGVGSEIDTPRLEEGLASGRYGCIKVYLGYIHQYASDPRYEPAYRLAEKYDVPVVFHTGDTYSTRGKLKYSDPLTLDEVAVDHPNVAFVIAHCGNPWIQSAAEVAYKNPNVYLECSALLIGDLEHTPAEQVSRYLVEPIRWIFGYLEDPTKLMFGTDWPLVGMRPYLEAYRRAIPKQHWRAVFFENARRVFHLP
ncbi:MAG: amidohydrolase family protein [Deltaproteobacteria bacterium]|nr:amidohydrolase family protein [Deltaproteobacteria bacterium]